MDNCCYSRDLMASWYGYFVYNGRINSYPSRSCFNCSGVLPYFREEVALANKYCVLQTIETPGPFSSRVIYIEERVSGNSNLFGILQKKYGRGRSEKN